MNVYQLEVPLPSAELRRIRGHVAYVLDELSVIRDRVPEDQLALIGAALLTAQGELSGLLNEGGD